MLDRTPNSTLTFLRLLKSHPFYGTFYYFKHAKKVLNAPNTSNSYGAISV